MALTAEELINLIDTKWSRTGSDRISSQDLRDVGHELVYFGAGVDNPDSLPDWNSSLTFNADGTGAGKYSKFPDSLGNTRFFETKVNGNTNHQPPTDPAVHEDAFWKEVSPSTSSSIVEWSAGVYGTGLIIVYHNHSDLGDILCKLSNPVRPFTSINIETEIEAGDWAIIGGTSGGGGGGGFLSGTWKFKNVTTATDPATGYLQVNNAALASVTAIYFSEISGGGTNVQSLFGLLHVGHEIIIQQKDDATRLASYKISGVPVDNGAFWTVPVTVIDHGGVMYANNKDLAVVFDLTEEVPPLPDASNTVKGIAKSFSAVDEGVPRNDGSPNESAIVAYVSAKVDALMNEIYNNSYISQT